MARFDSPEYAEARKQLAVELAPRVVEMDATFDAVEAIITKGPLTITKLRGFRESGEAVRLSFALLAKSLKTFRAIRVSALEGCGEDAAVLLRSLFETTTAIVWVLQGDSLRRTRLYGAHAAVRHLITIQQRLDTPGLKRKAKKSIKLAEAAVALWEKLIGADGITSVKKHWSGLPSGLEGVSRKIRGWHRAYNTVYRDTSRHAHGADPMAHIRPPLERTSLGTFPILPGNAGCIRVMTTANILLISAGRRINERLGLNIEALVRKQ